MMVPFLCIFISLTPPNNRVRFYIEPELVQAGDQLQVKLTSKPVEGGAQPFQGVYLSGLLDDAVIWMYKNQRENPARASGNLFNFPFRVTWRDMKGKEIHRRAWKVKLGYGQPGHIRATYQNDTAKEFDYDLLKYPEGIASLINFFIAPGTGKYPWEGQKEMLFEVSYGFPKSISIFKDSVEGFPLAAPIYEPIQLSVSRCIKTGNIWRLATSLQAREFGSARANLSKKQQDLENYMATVPSDRHRARQLLDSYKKNNLRKAWDYALDYQPFFVNTANSNKNIKWKFGGKDGFSKKEGTSIELGRITSVRRALFKRRDSFPIAPQAWVDITSPAEGDMVAGKVPISFVLSHDDPRTELLSVECFVNGNKESELIEPPFILYAPISQRQNEITIRATFNNETAGEDRIHVNGVPVLEEHESKVANLQVVALDRRRKFLPLTMQNLEIRERGSMRKIDQLYRDERPLDVVVLLDTSFSMRPHIYRAQQAVNQFLENLNAKESATVYSFDEYVQRIVDWEMSPEDRRDAIFTLTPRASTAMYDAILAARNVLLAREQVTKAIIIIADGNDTSSVTSMNAIKSIMKGTPIRVYSFFLGENRTSWTVIRQMSENSGGSSRVIGSAAKLNKAFDEILQELRSLYFVSYRSTGETHRLSVNVGRKDLPFLRVEAK